MKRSIRLAAVLLTLSLLIGMVAALSYDLNSDGKTNVWDLQMAVNQGKTAEEQAAALKEALGGNSDELHPNGDGVYEIWTALGLYNMAATSTEGNTYRLMADIDLNGGNWSPIPVFKGTLEGNGKTVSCFTVTKAVSGSDGGNMGFIAVLDHNGSEQSLVKDLNLKDVTVIVPEGDVRYIGLIAGSNRGIVENCTTAGIIRDNRTSLQNNAYIGTLVGRNNNSTPAGKVVSGENLLTGTTGSSNPQDKVAGLTSQVALDLSALTDTTYTRSIGIAGNTKDANIDTAMIWQDTSGSIAYKSVLEQQRRQAVVDEMYRMGTVKWTTSELLYYTASKGATSTHSNAYIPGRTYIGLPYNNCGGGYVRFLSVMQEETDDQGRYVTKTGLESGVEDENNVDTGFTIYAGNDCSTAVGWAWNVIAPALVSNHGARVTSTSTMTPNEYNTPKFGMLTVGGYQVIESDLETYPAAQDARNTRTLIELNGGAAGMAEFYAKASRGDALLYKNTSQAADGTWESNGGHARLLAYDPMIVRNYKGVIDLDASFVITHEQGDGLYDCQLSDGTYEQYNGYGVKETSWRIDHKYTLNCLLSKEGYAASKSAGEVPGSGWGYVPITIETFSYEGDLRKPYYDDGYTDHPIVLPNSGWYYSNYITVCGEMTITDSQGNAVYEKTEYVALDGRGSDYQTVMLEDLFPDATAGLTAGETYTCTIRFLASNGVWTTKVNAKQFTYNG